MPEIPDLEAIAAVLNKAIVGVPITSAEVRLPIVIRRPPKDDFIRLVSGNSIERVERVAKYLLFTLKSGHILAVHLMLTGRLQYAEQGEKLPPRTCWVLTFSNGKQLRHYGERADSKVYLLPVKELVSIPGWTARGPDALSPELTYEVFRQRIQRYTGQIKNVLTNERFIAGIGSAYADETLFEAGIYPFRARTKLSEDDLQRLYKATHSVFAWAMPIVAKEMGERTDVKYRELLRVHRKGGQPCPKCGAKITEVNVNQRITSYCRTCQGWG